MNIADEERIASRIGCSYYLPLDTVNRANRVICQARAVADLVSFAGDADLETETLANTAWLLRDMLDELNEIANSKR